MSDTDKELLELAAKAAGYSLYIWGTKGEENVVRVDEERHYRWNPLTDDGDALRLAVKLKLNVEFGNRYYFDEGPMTFCGKYWDSTDSEYYKYFQKHKDDPYAATRRAIVRAAAEIGKTK